VYHDQGVGEDDAMYAYGSSITGSASGAAPFPIFKLLAPCFRGLGFNWYFLKMPGPTEPGQTWSLSGMYLILLIWKNGALSLSALGRRFSTVLLLD